MIFMKRIFSILVVFVLLCGCSQKYPEHLSEKQITELRKEYPYDNGMNPLIDIQVPELAAYVDIASAYIVGKVVEAGYTDWVGSWRYYPLMVRIEEVAYDKEFGLKEGDVITVRLPDYEYEYGMEFPNDYTFLMPLNASEEEYVSSRFGWYYVTPDAYVLSVISRGDLDDFSGCSLREFGKTLEDMKG